MYKPICKWCMRYDCEEKGGSRKQCPIDRNEGPDQITQASTIKFQQERLRDSKADR